MLFPLGGLNAGVAIKSLKHEIFVSPVGSDSNNGTFKHPFLTLEAALKSARGMHGAEIVVRGGVYRLNRPLTFSSADSGIAFRAQEGEQPILSGSFLIRSRWEPFRDGIFKTQVPNGTETDRLFVNGVSMPLARYPNIDPTAKVFEGASADALSRERIAKWKDPTGGFVHAIHANEWGSVHYRIDGKASDGTLKLTGGWQNNRPAGMKHDAVFVEGIFEELDAPGEWFLNRKTSTLYYHPKAGEDLARSVIEGSKLSSLVRIEGSESSPVRDVKFDGFTFRGTTRTFMENREPLLRSDWTIYRGGAFYAKGSEGCEVRRCLFDSVGGNAVFVDGYNRHFHFEDSRIENAGANGVAFVGSPSAVRNPLHSYDERLSLADLDLTPGPKSDEYPSDCTVQDCLITRTGRIDKQSAPVEIAMSRRITIRNCSIYDVPRAGINIGDGCWGGHLIEGCDVFDTVKETGDHGSFNSWGRDRYWGLKDVDLNTLDADGRGMLPLLDVMEPNVLRHNRWRCDHGWDIDLDDGSSNYRIVDNLCLHGGLKLREGFDRVCENNVIVDNSFHFHVWFKDSHDVIRRNIVTTPYQVIQVDKPFGKELDDNLLLAGAPLSSQSGRDSNSLVGDAEFLAPFQGDYRVGPNSPALKLGFKNFPMDDFGVTDPRLRAIAKRPKLPVGVANRAATSAPFGWLGATLKKLETVGERSVVGSGS